MTDNLRASLLMVLTMAGFAMQDLFIKLASGTLPIGEIMLLIGLSGTLVMYVAAKRKGVNLLDPVLLARPFLLRFAGEFFGSLFVFKALSLLPLSTTSAIGQAAPVATTIGAALFLGEKVGWRRWTAVVVGLVGVVLVVQPGSDGFNVAALLALGSVVAYAARDLATRRMPKTINTYHATFWGYVSVLPCSFVMIWTDGFVFIAPNAVEWGYLFGAGIFGIIFYWTLTLALQMGEASLIAPLRYSRIVFALILATVVLGEMPNTLMLVGLVLVIGSGLYTVLREARFRRRPAASKPAAPGI